MGFFQRRDPAEAFRDSRVDLVYLEGPEGQEAREAPVDPVDRVEAREGFSHQRHRRRNSYRKCPPPHMPSIPAGSDAACSATPTSG